MYLRNIEDQQASSRTASHDALEGLPGERLARVDEVAEVLLDLAPPERRLALLERSVELLGLGGLLGEDVDLLQRSVSEMGPRGKWHNSPACQLRG